MLYRSLLGKGLPMTRLVSVAPHRGSFAASNVVLPSAIHQSSVGPSTVAMAGSPLFVTDLSKPFDFSEIQFVLSEQVCRIYQPFSIKIP
jgi:hypothetical protein